MTKPLFGRARRRATRCLVTLALILAAGPLTLHAQGVANGVLLVASPELTDANFAHSVVLVLRHDDNGTLGVVINRPTNVTPTSVFPELADSLGDYSGRLFRGGPVGPTRLLFVVQGLAAAAVEGPEVLDKVFLSIDTESLPDMTRLAKGIEDLRLYAGHAEWAPGQLDAEIRAGGWQLVPGTPELVFDDAPGELWSELEGLAGNAGGVIAASPVSERAPLAANRR